MRFENVQLEGKQFRFSDLEHLLPDLGFDRSGQWDYERVTYDYKFEDMSNGDIYYLRLQAVAVRGEIENPFATVQLKTPILGKYYYPHGVEYDEEFPASVVRKCEQVLQDVKEHLENPEH